MAHAMEPRNPTRRRRPWTSRNAEFEEAAMEMFLMVLALSLIGVAVCAVLFAAATRDVKELGAGVPAQVRPPSYAPPQFFAEHAGQQAASQVPIEVLLLQLERHIRVEQAAAEAFLHYPTAESLHMRTTSPLVH
jgi:hypothetical protein